MSLLACGRNSRFTSSCSITVQIQTWLQLVHFWIGYAVMPLQVAIGIKLTSRYRKSHGKIISFCSLLRPQSLASWLILAGGMFIIIRATEDVRSSQCRSGTSVNGTTRGINSGYERWYYWGDVLLLLRRQPTKKLSVWVISSQFASWWRKAKE